MMRRRGSLAWLALAGALGCASADETNGAGVGAAGGGGGAASGGGGAGGAAVEPIEAPPGKWTFVPIEGMACGNASPTGIGIHPHTGAKRLLLFLEGGGACYDAPTCTGPSPSASHFTGYGAADLAQFEQEEGVRGKFDRGDAGNPFKDDAFVFVPYCTGDVHAGDRVDGELHFVGHKNLVALLPRLVATFGDAELVVLAGSSAGGFGAMYNFWHVQQAFGDVPVTMIDDSGPLLSFKSIGALAFVAAVWGLEATAPPGCAKCLDAADPDGGPHNLVALYAEKLPGRRGSLLSSLRDKTIADRFMITQDALEQGLAEYADRVVPKNPDFRVYYLAGEHHVWLDGGEETGKLADVTSNGVSLATFLSQQLAGDPQWKSVRP